MASGGVTLLLLLMIYLWAGWSEVSTGEYAARILRFSPAVAPAASAPSSGTTMTAPEAANVSTEGILPERVKISIDPSASLSRAEMRATTRTPDITDTSVRRRSMPNPLPLRRREIRPQVSNPEIRRRTLTGSLSTRLSLPTTRPTLDRRDSPPPLAVPDTEEFPETRPEAETPQVRTFDETTLTETDVRTQEIIAWVRQNPSHIPPVAKTHMDYIDGDHLARVQVWVDGVVVELFLLVRSGYSQLHVLMVTGGKSYLFHDRGGKGEAERFRVGNVRHTDGEISRIVSQEREITSEEAQTFYRIFMNWWETKTTP